MVDGSGILGESGRVWKKRRRRRKMKERKKERKSQKNGSID